MLQSNSKITIEKRKYTGAEITIKLLEQLGTEVIAGMPGGANLPIYIALNKSDKIQHVLIRHEQAAGFIAQGISRTTGKAAVCFATSGPGVVNLMTSIADAKLDSIPVIAITGQVSSSLIGTDAFQEVDTYGLTLPIVKHSYLVSDIKELFEVIPRAFEIALEGRPGPVWVDIPKDVQNAQMEIEEWPQIKVKKESRVINDLDIEKAVEMIHKSKRPVLYIGGGIVHSNAHEKLYELAQRCDIPVTSTLMGLGCFSIDHPLSLGMIGMHGARYTNKIVNEADLLIALGVRFDDRATGKVSKFCPNAEIIHVDIDKAEIDKIKKTSLSMVGDVGEVLEKLLLVLKKEERKDWIDFVNQTKREYPFDLPMKKDLMHPIYLIQKISEDLTSDTIITTDVGQHQMWVAQAYPFKKPRTFLTSGGLGTMGFGLPTAIGAAIANPKEKVVCLTGDGSILMNIQELATLAELNLDVTVIIMNNGHLGLVRQQQELFYEQNYIASKFIANPDFAMIASGFGIVSYDLQKEQNPEEVLVKALSKRGPCVINAPIYWDENVIPMVPPGAGNDEMVGELKKR